MYTEYRVLVFTSCFPLHNLANSTISKVERTVGSVLISKKFFCRLKFWAESTLPQALVFVQVSLSGKLSRADVAFRPLDLVVSEVNVLLDASLVTEKLAANLASKLVYLQVLRVNVLLQSGVPISPESALGRIRALKDHLALGHNVVFSKQVGSQLLCRSCDELTEVTFDGLSVVFRR